MDKTSEKVTKDPTRVEQGKKSYKTHMKRLKEQILEEHQPPTSSTSDPTPFTCHPTSSTCDPTSSTSSSTCDPTPSTSSHRSNDIYVYGVGMLALLAIGVCVFFAYNTTQAKTKKS